MDSFPHVFQPIRIGTMELANRIVMCPMGTKFASEEGMPTAQMINYYAERAKGGVGLVTVEQTAVHPGGKWCPQTAGMWDERLIPAWRKLVDAVHFHGSKIAVELGHMGASARPEVIGGQPVGPSPLPDYLVRVVPHELTREEIRQIIDYFAAAAARAVKAGFDAVEIHGTHGYLLASFMSGRTNRRTDEYGGTLEGRLRLPRQIIGEVRRVVGKNYPLLMRIASVEPKGGRLLEETRVVAKALAEEGLDAIDVSAGSFYEYEWEVPPYFFSPAFNMVNIEAIKRSAGVPVIGAGRVTEPRLAERLIAEGRIDLVGIGRALIADPQWPEKAASGRVDEIRRCIGCTRCLDFLLHSEYGKLACNVNPYVGREGQMQIVKAAQKKRVLVVGGGPAGLFATAIAASRGHDVTLWERENSFGGQIRVAALAPQKHEIASIISWAHQEAEKAGGRLESGKIATVDNILEFHPDALVIATGAKPLLPAIPGINGTNVVTAFDLLAGKATAGNRVLVVGGGDVGCEVAHFLAIYDKQVTIVEMLDAIGSNLGFAIRPTMLRTLSSLGIAMITRAKVLEILPDGVLLERNGAKETLRGYDNVVIAMGSRAENTLYREIKNKVAEAYCIGDAGEPNKIHEALNDGLQVGLKI